MSKFVQATKSKLQSGKQLLIARLKVIKSDYVSAGKDTWAETKEHPLRSLFYLGAFSFGVYAYKKVPTESSYTSTVVECSNDLVLQSDATRNKDTDDFVQSVLYLRNKSMLRYQRLGFFSLMYTAEYDINDKTYRAQCKYTKPRWIDFHKQILDVGFLGRWWTLQYMMTDYDVNFAELPKDFDSFWKRYLDHLKKLFGYSYYNIVPQPQKTSLYVFTPDNNNNSTS